MRRSETAKIKDLIDTLMRHYGAEEKIIENRIINSWEKVLGKTIAGYTSKLFIKDRKLYVSVRSSIVKAELLMIKEQIINRLNEKAGKVVIDQIIIK